MLSLAVDFKRFMPKKRILIILSLISLIVVGIIFRELRAFRIVDVHEHIESEAELDRLMAAMKKQHVKKVALLGTPVETILLNGKKTFTEYDQNNSEILRIAEKDPDHFYAFCTIDPRDTKKLKKLKECILSGGTGLKLYTGNGFFYDTFGLTLDDPGMEEIYAYCQEHRLPIVFHVNGDKYSTEFETVLKRFPDLIINVPHFALLSAQLPRLQSLLERYPNLYTDISFGHIDFTVDGFKRLSEEIEKYREFFKKYPDHILFATDEVITKVKWKDASYLKERFQCYRDLLEKETFTCPLIDRWQKEKGKESPLLLNGLSLSRPVLKQIYEVNAERFLSGKGALEKE